MALLSILHYPDQRLHTVASPVQQVNAEIRKLVDDMAQTMYAAPGIGLAATQVNVHKQVIVIDISEKHDQLMALINPQNHLPAMAWRSARKAVCRCREFTKRSRRAERVTVAALDRDGKPFTLDAEGLLAVCIQHEIDHLQGKVFVEYLSRLKQTRIKMKMQKLQRETM